MKDFECKGCHWCPDTFLCRMYAKYKKSGKVGAKKKTVVKKRKKKDTE